MSPDTGGEADLGYGSVYEWRTLGRSLTYLALEAAAYALLTLWLDHDSRHGASAAAVASVHSWLGRSGPACLISAPHAQQSGLHCPIFPCHRCCKHRLLRNRNVGSFPEQVSAAAQIGAWTGKVWYPTPAPAAIMDWEH